MSKDTSFFNLLFNDIIAMVLSVFVSLCPFFIADQLFGEDTSLFYYLVSIVITFIVAGLGAGIIIRLIANQHKIAVNLLYSLGLLVFVAYMLIDTGDGDILDSMLLLFTDLFPINGCIVGLIILGIFVFIISFLSIVEVVKERFQR